MYIYIYLASIIQLAGCRILIHVPVTNATDPPFLGRLGLLRVLRQRKAADFDGLDLRPLVVLSFAEVMGYGLTWVSGDDM